MSGQRPSESYSDEMEVALLNDVGLMHEDGVLVWICLRCAALVSSQEHHDAWHRTIEKGSPTSPAVTE